MIDELNIDKLKGEVFQENYVRKENESLVYSGQREIRQPINYMCNTIEKYEKFVD